MASENRNNNQVEKERFRSIFELPEGFFDSCRLLHDGTVSTCFEYCETSAATVISEEVAKEKEEQQQQETSKKLIILPRWSCHTCKAEFESLQDQRSHFKSDFHRFNVKLHIVGKDSIKEEDFDDCTSDFLFKDNDISSISGSDDEIEKGSCPSSDIHKIACGSAKQKVFIYLKTGEVVSFWKCLLMSDSENISYDNDKALTEENGRRISYVREMELLARFKNIIQEPREKAKLRIVLLASGGHFAGCVFDGNSVVAHKTFHRYVVRAKSGKKQSSKDASGRAAHSAGASLRRYNELNLKKEIQELLAAWKPYFDVSSSIFIYAPSNNRQLLYNGDTPYFSHTRSVVRHIPFTVRRPTFKEAKRVYTHLTAMVYEVINKGSQSNRNDASFQLSLNGDSLLGVSGAGNTDLRSTKDKLEDDQPTVGTTEACQVIEDSDVTGVSEIISKSTALHEAGMTGDTLRILELLEQGLDPCIKDQKGRTPYMLATDKEARNTFRRFMALNLDKWDWNAAKVPSPLTKEMEESQAAKQAEKDAKRKAKAKELKKSRKAKEKKAQEEAILAEKAWVEKGVVKGQADSMGVRVSKEEEVNAEREKRAAAAEKRITGGAAAVNLQGTSSINCWCCNVSLAGKVPFHRYHYKYCSTSCMHVHREILEDD